MFSRERRCSRTVKVVVGPQSLILYTRACRHRHLKTAFSHKISKKSLYCGVFFVDNFSIKFLLGLVLFLGPRHCLFSNSTGIGLFCIICWSRRRAVQLFRFKQHWYRPCLYHLLEPQAGVHRGVDFGVHPIII